MCANFNITNIFGTEVLACFGKRNFCKEGDGIKKGAIYGYSKRCSYINGYQLAYH